LAGAGQSPTKYLDVNTILEGFKVLDHNPIMISFLFAIEALRVSNETPNLLMRPKTSMGLSLLARTCGASIADKKEHWDPTP